MNNILVTYNGKQILLDDNNYLGAGGEGTIYRDGNWAIKVIHEHLCQAIRFEKIEKQINKKMSANSVAPQAIVYYENKPRGYAMEYVDLTLYDSLSWWIDLTYRRDNNITSEDVVQIFRHIWKELKENAALGYVFGDFNLGSIFVLKKTYWSNNHAMIKIVDTDTVGFDNYPPSPAISWAYSHPIILEKAKQKGTSFAYSKETDIFQFTALFFHVLTTVNVWEGYHPQFREPKKMFMAGKTVFHSNVEYPTDGLPLHSLPEKLRNYFTQIFLGTEKQWQMKSEIFESKDVFIFRKSLVDHGKSAIMSSKQISSKGNKLDFMVFGNSAYAILSQLDKQLIFKLFTDREKEYSLTYQEEMIYRIISSSEILVYPRVIQQKSFEAVIKNVVTKEEKKIQINSGQNNKSPVFSIAPGILYFAIEGTLYQYYANSLTPIKNTPKNIELFAGENGFGMIVHSGIRKLFYVLFGDRFHTIEIETDKVLYDAKMIVSKQSAVIVLEIKDSEDYYEMHYVDSSGKSYRLDEKIAKYDVKNLNSLYLYNENLYYITKDGLTRVNFKDKSINIFDQTKSVVKRGHRFCLYQNGFFTNDLNSNDLSFVSMS